jgi:hypothetical protein
LILIFKISQFGREFPFLPINKTIQVIFGCPDVAMSKTITNKLIACPSVAQCHGKGMPNPIGRDIVFDTNFVCNPTDIHVDGFGYLLGFR